MLISAELTYLEGALLPNFAIETDGRTVTALRPLKAGEKAERHLKVLAPGLTDLQVNGGGGVLLNTSPTPEGLRAIRAAHLSVGTAAILPTLITDAAEVMEQAADAVISTKGEAGLLGIHIEGPHIAPARKGTHDPAHIRPLDARTLAVLRRLRDADIPVLLTLAPRSTTPPRCAKRLRWGSCCPPVTAWPPPPRRARGSRTASACSPIFTMPCRKWNRVPPALSRRRSCRIALSA
ncbi:hypothetical protein QWZ10_15725 [Paracoccus cavernae]|uniref:N-acetylglucosamine-6-phosphate deacetylase n=1 Tax=Paracoccus cavernae TaxID=1571207 RepID=A0ABT8D9A6_9RHOB|nr:hypothetical protein [Paracoccus cavernae]